MCQRYDALRLSVNTDVDKFVVIESTSSRLFVEVIVGSVPGLAEWRRGRPLSITH
jgi:hypothetical protein